MEARRSICDEFYSKSPDPWQFRTSWYERRKREIVVASLPRRRFGSCWELGCSVGELTAALAPRCARVLATDGNAVAVQQARGRVREFPHAAVEQQIHPDDWPNELFDLIVFSELGYNFDADSLRALADRLATTLLPSGMLVGCHWRHAIPNCPISGDEVHRIVAAALSLPRLVQHVEEDFVLDIWSADVRSVAASEGML
jgi:SAM-dependent methyltransferase